MKIRIAKIDLLADHIAPARAEDALTKGAPIIRLAQTKIAQLGDPRGEGLGHGDGAIVRSIFGEDDLIGLAEPLHLIDKAEGRRLEDRLLVIDGDDDADHKGHKRARLSPLGFYGSSGERWEGARASSRSARRRDDDRGWEAEDIKITEVEARGEDIIRIVDRDRRAAGVIFGARRGIVIPEPSRLRIDRVSILLIALFSSAELGEVRDIFFSRVIERVEAMPA